MRLFIATLITLLCTGFAVAQMEIDAESLRKAAAASEAKAKAEAMAESLKDSAGFVIVVLDKDGGQRGGQVVVSKTDPAYTAVKKVIDEAIAANKASADKLFGEAGVKLKTPAQ